MGYKRWVSAVSLSTCYSLHGVVFVEACTQFILPGGTDNVTDMFPELPFTLDQRDAYCRRVWQVTPRNHWSKISLWGKGLLFLLFLSVLLCC